MPFRLASQHHSLATAVELTVETEGENTSNGVNNNKITKREQCLKRDVRLDNVPA
jgi:hypothetical protein